MYPFFPLHSTMDICFAQVKLFSAFECTILGLLLFESLFLKTVTAGSILVSKNAFLVVWYTDKKKKKKKN